MQALLASEVPVASSCGGEGVCGKCRLLISLGEKNLSTPQEAELFLKEKYQLKKNERISCQVFVHGDIEVDAGYW